MLIVNDRHGTQLGELIRDELILMGVAVEMRGGSRGDFEKATRSPTFHAVVLAAPSSARISVMEDGKESRSVVRKGSKETSELLALRCAELLRARLLPAEPAAAPQPAPPPPGAAAGWVEGAMGPQLLLRGYGGAALGWGGDLSAVLGRVRLGVYAAGSLTRTPWALDPKHFSFQDFSSGAKFAWEFANSKAQTTSFRILTKFGITAVTVRTESGPADAQWKASYLTFPLEFGAEVHHALFRWFFVGGVVSGGVAFPITTLDPERASHPPQVKALEKARTTPTAIGSAAVLLGVVF